MVKCIDIMWYFFILIQRNLLFFFLEWQASVIVDATLRSLYSVKVH